MVDVNVIGNVNVRANENVNKNENDCDHLDGHDYLDSFLYCAFDVDFVEHLVYVAYDHYYTYDVILSLNRSPLLSLNRKRKRALSWMS